MLDVHPPEHAASTWRDFFIHIATIVIGLLIAVGLEQAVELIHRHHQLQETRDALAHERTANGQTFGVDTAFLAHNINALQNDLIVLLYLKAHPGTPAAKLPGVVFWPNLQESLSDIAWRSAQSSNGLQLMPQDEVFENAQLYEALTAINAAADQSWDAVSQATAYSLRDPDITHLSAAELDHEIELTQQALLGKYRLGVGMANVGLAFKDFKPAPDLRQMEQLSVAPPVTAEQREALSAARQITRERMARTPLPPNPLQ